jgi:hypothetical protein
MKIYIVKFRTKFDHYYVMDTKHGNLKKFFEWLWFGIEY